MHKAKFSKYYFRPLVNYILADRARALPGRSLVISIKQSFCPQNHHDIWTFCAFNLIVHLTFLFSGARYQVASTPCHYCQTVLQPRPAQPLTGRLIWKIFWGFADASVHNAHRISWLRCPRAGHLIVLSDLSGNDESTQSQVRQTVRLWQAQPLTCWLM